MYTGPTTPFWERAPIERLHSLFLRHSTAGRCNRQNDSEVFFTANCQLSTLNSSTFANPATMFS